MLRFISFSFIFISIEALSIRPDQSIGVSGTLLCNKKPASNVLVKLYDHDSMLHMELYLSARRTKNPKR
jgi:hypothetical protein